MIREFHDLLGKTWACECLGCALADGSVVPPGGILWEGEHFILHHDPEVPIAGFLILASKAHVRSLADLPMEAAQEMTQTLFLARKALAALPGLRHCTVIQEERSTHFHLWLLPRYPWMDELFDDSLTTIRPLLRYAKERRRTQETARGVLDAVHTIRNVLNA